jgi:hypothetical protein
MNFFSNFTRNFFQVDTANFLIYFSYFVLLMIIFFYYKNSSYLNFDRENKTDYEFDGVIPKDSRKVIVYSCLIGNYDNVTSFNKQRGYDYILFTDQNIIKKTNWTIFPIPDEVLKLNVSDIKKQRYMKIHPHKFFKNYDLSLYIDPNYEITGDLDDYLINTLNPLDHIYIPHLQFGKGIKQAIEKAIEKKLDDVSLLKNVMDRYNQSKLLDKTGIVNAGLIIRKHHTEDCIKLMERWWEEVRDYSHVDNFAFDYAGYMTGVRYLYTSYQFALFYFKVHRHLKDKEKK